MRKITILILLLFIMARLYAQNYLITFAGSGASDAVDSVRVANLTQGTSLTVGAGNQLQLLGTLSVNDYVNEGAGSSLQIYPNPAREETVLTFEATASAHANITITDLSGHQVAGTQVFLNTGRHTFHVSGLCSGSYTVQIKSAKYQYTGKIISQLSSVNKAQINYYAQSSGKAGYDIIKNAEAVIQMQYTSGDLLKFTGKSGIYATVVMDIPTTSKTITFDFAPCTDYDNNHYAIVLIGNQAWMEESLKSKHYADGTSINYFDYDHDPNNSLIYGKLYAWSAAMNGAASSNTNPRNVQGVCPDGWHLPSKAEWQQFAGFLGGLNIAGGKLKESGNAHWISPNTGATDETGFTALPGGMWAFWDEFQWMGDHGAFSTSTGNLTQVEVTAIMLQTLNGTLTVGSFHPDDAVSVRCVKN